MKTLSSIIILTFFLSSCEQQKNQGHIDWKVAGSLSATNQQAHIGVAGPVVGILEGKLLIAGGANFPEKMPWDGGTKNYQADAYLYDLSGDSLVFSTKINFPDTLAYSSNVNIGDAIYAIGGENKSGISNYTTKYSLHNGQVQSARLANLPIPLSNGAAVKVGDYIYYIGGENSDSVSDKVFKLSLENDKWEEAFTLPYAVTHTVAVTDDISKIYVIGGRKRNSNAKSDMYDQVLEIDLQASQIKEIAKLPKALAAGTGVYSKNKLIVIGGDDASTFHRVEELIGEINTSNDDEVKKELILKKKNIQMTHPGFSKEVLALNLDNVTWERLNPIIGDSPVTTTAIIHDGKIIIPSGESRPGVRTLQILVGTL